MERYQLLQGDCREVLKTLPDNSVDSIVTDPPYELGFMGKAWDATGKASMLEGMRYIGIEMNPEYIKIAEARISNALNQ